MAKFISNEGLQQVWTRITALLGNKVDKVSGKQLSTNDYTTTEKNKLAGIAAGAQVNKIESVSVNGSALPISSKGVNVDLSNYALKSDITALFKWKGTKETVSGLPSSNNAVGDAWHVNENGAEYVWNGTQWEPLGIIIDLSPYLTKTEAGNLYLLKTTADTTYAPKTHTHTSAQITDLQDKLDAKANATHTHAISDVTGLQNQLNAKALKTELPVAMTTEEITAIIGA